MKTHNQLENLHFQSNWPPFSLILDPFDRRGGGGGGLVLHQIFGTWVQHTNKIWTQLDQRFCENEVSKRFKIKEKEGQLNRKLRENLDKMLKICKIIHFGEKLHQLYVLVSLELNVIRDEPISFSRKRGSIALFWGIKLEPNRIENPWNGGHHHGTSLPCPSMEVPPGFDPSFLQNLRSDLVQYFLPKCLWSTPPPFLRLPSD